MKNRNIILIGMPGAGKSTVGVILAKTLGFKFIDSDIVIQEREGRLLQEIIDDRGITYFLKAEESALLSLDCKSTVIATGGSAVLSEKAMNCLKSAGTAVYIKVGIKELEKRLNNITTRGIVKENGQNIEDISRIREPLYEKYADITADAEKLSVEEIVLYIKNILEE